MDREKLIHDMILMLIYLTSWKEDAHVGTVMRFWKGYDRNTVDALCDEGLIDASHRARPVYLTDQGEERAKQLVASYETFNAVLAETER